MNITDKLFELQDLKYKEFHSRLCPNNKNIIGVKIPVLRKLSKQLYKEDKNILSKLGNEYYEEVMLQGMIISLLTISVEEKLEMIEGYVLKIDNWAICDIFCSSLKIKTKDKYKYWNFLKKYYDSNSEFEIRFLIIMLLDHFLEEEYLNEICDIIKNIANRDYYVKMAIAWLLSVMYIKFPTFMLENFDKLNLDKWTYNKTIQKIIESSRVDKEVKLKLKELKK